MISRLYGVSVLVEVGSAYEPIPLQTGPSTLFQLASSIGPHLEISCVSGNVLRIYDTESQSSPSNALNFRFVFFQVAPTLPIFALDLRARLAEEPWVTFDPKHIIRPGQGGIPYDYKAQAILPADLKDITARAVLISVATQIRMISVLQLPLRKEESPKAQWQDASSTWQLRIE